MTHKEINARITDHLSRCKGPVKPDTFWKSQAFYCWDCGSNWPHPEEPRLRLVRPTQKEGGEK